MIVREDTLLFFPKVGTGRTVSLGPRAVCCEIPRYSFFTYEAGLWKEVSGGLGAPASFSQGGYRRHPLRRELDGT